MAAKAKKKNADAEAQAISRKRAYAACIVFLLVCGLGWQADRLLDVHVKKVQIEGELSQGERQAVRDTISEAIEASGAAGLHSLSLDEVRSAVARLSWADRVSARRRWPDTLVVQLMRHTVVARWGGGGFVASNGEVITPPASDSAVRSELPLLNCLQASSAKAMEVFSVLSRTLSDSGLTLVELNESLLGEWTAGIVNRSQLAGSQSTKVLVALGNDDLAPRLQRFLAVRAEVANRAEFGSRFVSVDARYHNGVAVRFPHSSTKLDGGRVALTQMQETVR